MEGRLIAGSNLVVFLILAHLMASIAAVEFRNLRTATWAILIQSTFLTLIFVTFGSIFVNPTLYWWSLSTFISKVIIIPLLLFAYIRKMPQMEIRPFIGHGVSLAIVSIILVLLYRFIHTYVEFITPNIEATMEPSRSSLAIAFTIFALGMYTMVTRRDAIKVVIGVCLLENGVHLSLVTLAPTLPETTVIGICTNVVVAAYLLLYLSYGVYKQFGSTDTYKLSQLKY